MECYIKGLFWYKGRKLSCNFLYNTRTNDYRLAKGLGSHMNNWLKVLRYVLVEAMGELLAFLNQVVYLWPWEQGECTLYRCTYYTGRTLRETPHLSSWDCYGSLTIRVFLCHPCSLTRQSSWETGLLLPGWLMSQTFTQPLPPVYTCLVGLLMVTAHTTSPWLRVLICRACRGIPGPMRASGGNGTGCIWPSAVTWKEYALHERKKDILITKGAIAWRWGKVGASLSRLLLLKSK